MVVVAGLVVVLPILAVVVIHPSLLSEFFTGAKRLLSLATPQSGDVLAVSSLLRWLLIGSAALAVLAGLALWRGGPAPLVAATVGLLALDLLVMGYGYNPSIPKTEAAPARPPAVKALQDLSVGGARVVGIGGLEPNTASRWGSTMPGATNSPWWSGTSASGTRWAVAVGLPPRWWTLETRARRPCSMSSACAPCSSTRSCGRGASWSSLRALQGDRVAYAGPGALVLEHRSALPRAYVAYRWRPSSGLQESLWMMALGTSREARDESVIETSDPSSSRSTRRATPARFVRRSDTEVVLNVRAREAGQLILLDTFYPGWSAEVDGRSAQIRAANGSFRAVEVPAGRHEVRFTYRPASVIAGGAISIAAFLVLIACLVVARRRRAGADDQAPKHARREHVSV